MEAADVRIMGSLLSAKAIRTIKRELKKVTDTFFITPIVIHRYVGTLDRFNEDSNKPGDFKDYSLKCMLEFPSGSSQVQFTQAGTTAFYDVKASINYADIKLADLSYDNETLLNQAKDCFTTNSKRYKVQSVALDGPIEAENCLLILYGKLEERKT